VTAQHQTPLGGEKDVRQHRVTQPPGVVADVAADDRRHVRIVENVTGKADRARRLEGNAGADDAGADVLDRVVDRAPVRLCSTAGDRLDRVVAMRQRVPEPVAVGVARMPVEPPLDHLGADPRHLGAHGDVADAIRAEAPAGLDRKRRGIEQAIDPGQRNHLRRVHRPGPDRPRHLGSGRRQRPREVGLKGGIVHRLPQSRPIQG
jgi:hypothetical protein